MFESLISVSNKYELIVGFAVIGLMMWFSFWVSEKWTKGRIHGSAIAIMLGLTLAYVSGAISGEQKELLISHSYPELVYWAAQCFVISRLLLLALASNWMN